MQQDTVSRGNALCYQRAGSGLNAGGELRPGPGLLPPDDGRPVRKPAGRLQQEIGEIAGRDQRAASRIET
jgi:hypothetical protein